MATSSYCTFAKTNPTDQAPCTLSPLHKGLWVDHLLNLLCLVMDRVYIMSRKNFPHALTFYLSSFSSHKNTHCNIINEGSGRSVAFVVDLQRLGEVTDRGVVPREVEPSLGVVVGGESIRLSLQDCELMPTLEGVKMTHFSFSRESWSGSPPPQS